MKQGFTLLEVMMALAIALIVMAVAVPSVTQALSGSPAEKVFADFDALVQEARQRSHDEGRNYVIVWGREKTILMRPEEPGSRAEAEGLKRWKIDRDGELKLHLPAALTSKGTTPSAIWTFWADGACEPAEIRYKGASGKWSAAYSPFTARAEVRYE